LGSLVKGNHKLRTTNTMRDVIVLLALGFVSAVFGFNAPSDVLTWCGKPYMST